MLLVYLFYLVYFVCFVTPLRGALGNWVLGIETPNSRISLSSLPH